MLWQPGKMMSLEKHSNRGEQRQRVALSGEIHCRPSYYQTIAGLLWLARARNTTPPSPPHTSNRKDSAFGLFHRDDCKLSGRSCVRVVWLTAAERPPVLHLSN